MLYNIKCVDICIYLIEGYRIMASNILEKILKTKQKEILFLAETGKGKNYIAASGDMPPTRDFYKAVTEKTDRPLNLIAEIKKASPSKGLIRPNFDPVGLAVEYEAAGANALSVLTDEQYFMGALEYLGQARQAVGLPVLRKDFLIEPVQLHEARVAGADAVLLIAAALEPALLIDLHALAGELGMAVLLEVHNEEELEMVLNASFDSTTNWLLGVNNRNLDTFEVDLANTIRLRAMIPGEIPLVSESGIWNREDIDCLVGVGVDAVLVGESLMRSSDIGLAVRTLLG